MDRTNKIEIDNLFPFMVCPHYCRNDSDRVRWFAFKSGLISVIRPMDKVTFIPERNSYKLEVEEVVDG